MPVYQTYFKFPLSVGYTNTYDIRYYFNYTRFSVYYAHLFAKFYAFVACIILSKTYKDYKEIEIYDVYIKDLHMLLPHNHCYIDNIKS